MFWDSFANLCREGGKTPNAVAKELNISSGSITAWKNGTEPRSGTVKKIADYFGVSVSDLLGDEKKPVHTNELSDIRRAVDEELDKMTHEELEMALRLVRAFKNAGGST